MKCPCCDHPLHVGFELGENSFIAWCGHGACRSTKANEGAFGKTEELAMKNLVDALNKRPDWSDEMPETEEDRRLDAADHKNQMEKDDK